MSWYRKKEAAVLEPNQTIQEYPGMWYEAIRLKDGRMIYDETINHWELYYRYREIIGSLNNIESMGQLSGDGNYVKTRTAEQAKKYLSPTGKFSVNWYKRITLAQGVQQYLTYLGATPEIIEYILSQGNNMQYLINEFKKRPGLSLEQLQLLQFPQKKQIDPYLNNEKQIASRYQANPAFSKWILVNFRKLRKGVFYNNDNGEATFPMNHPNLTEQDYILYRTFSEKIPEIWDWVRNYNPDIASYGAEEAIMMSEEWHNMMAGKGEGLMYEPVKPGNIVYGPNWTNPEWKGWTIQRVISKNDLLAEGNKMNHCVGSYCQDVEEGTSIIYSLRDPKNEPHVTIEVVGDPKHYTNLGDPGHIQQIQGNSNYEPEPEYRPMIKEWLEKSAKSLGIKTTTDGLEQLREQFEYSSIPLSDYLITAKRILTQEPDEYGRTFTLNESVLDLLEEMADQADAEARSYRGESEYRDEATEIPGTIFNLALMMDLKLDHFPRDSAEWQSLKKKIPRRKIKWENIKKIENWAIDTSDEITMDFIHYDTGLEYPQEEDYDTTEEYEEALKEYDNAEEEIYSEWLGNSVMGGISKDILNYINTYRKSGVITNVQLV